MTIDGKSKVIRCDGNGSDQLRTRLATAPLRKPWLLELLGQVYNADDEYASFLRHQISDRAMEFSAQELRRYRFMFSKSCARLETRQRSLHHETSAIRDRT